MKPPGHGDQRRRRGWRRVLPGMVLAVLGLCALGWFLPARWAMPLIGARLHGVQLQQVHGLLWDGGAERVLAADGRPLGQLRWQLSRRALLGEVRMQLRFDGPALHFSGAMQRLPDDVVEWRDVQMTLRLGVVQPPLATPFGRPQGWFSLQAPHALLQGNWPMQVQATARWDDAAIQMQRGTVALGKLRFTLHAEQGTIDTHLHDAGNGPLALDGDAQVSPLGWRLDATLRPRTVDPALRRWLASLGRPDADGSVHLQRRGGLAAALPAKGAQP
jgi:general secretion pathway protein N